MIEWYWILIIGIIIGWVGNWLNYMFSPLRYMR